MNKLLAGALTLTAMASLTAMATPAVAADMPIKAPAYKAPVSTNWSGWYLGGHVGYLWGRTSVWDDGVLTESDAATNGAVGGVLAGGNWQSGAFVLGVEGDFGWTNAHGTGFAVAVTNRYDFNWTSHIRGRIGYATNNVLWFVAGGVALADFDYTQSVSALVVGTVYTGWSFGGGADIAINPNWIARIEYLHDDFGDKTYLISGDPYRVKLTGDTLRGALMYKF